MDGKVGSGVYIQGNDLNMEISEPLGKHASVFTAELVAIRIALVNLRQRSNLHVTLYSDSRSALQAMLVYNSENILVQDIQELVHELAENQVNILFCWVPSHVGITGNERADNLAKAALGIERQGIPSVFFSDFKGYLKNKIYHRWRERWIYMVDDNWTQLRGVQEFIRPRTWGAGLTRNEDIKITRLRIGHTKFSRDYYFTGEGEPECMECGEALTVEHVLLDCGNFYHERRQYFGDDDQSLNSLLGVPSMFPQVLAYFKAIDLYEKI
jgi:ribonuclease HI